MNHFNNKGFSLVNLLVVIVAILFLSSFLAKKVKSDVDFKAASLTASRIDLLLNEAYTYYRFNGKWPFHDGNCLGGNGVVVNANAVLPNVISSDWVKDVRFACNETNGIYSINYKIPEEWKEYMISNVSDTEEVSSSSGEALMVSTINMTGGKDKSEILVADFVRHGNKLEAELEANECRNEAESIWTYSVSAICNHTEEVPLYIAFPSPLLEGVTMKGWRLKVERENSDKYKFEAQSYKVERKTKWFLLVPYTDHKEKWVAAEDDCGGVVPRVTAFVQC